MLEQILSVINDISNFLWTYIVIALLSSSAIYFTIRLRGVQFLHIREMFKMLFMQHEEASNETCAKTSQVKHQQIGSFKAFAIGLSSRVGTGNLAGVASAICVGGPGAVFWMWLMALLGAATAFVESTLAQIYKRKGKESFYGGPAYYIYHGLHCKWLGIVFAIFLIFGFGISQQIVQGNTICDAISSTLEINKTIVGLAISILTLFIIFGGIHRISKFAALVVPIMALGYLILGIIVLIINWREIPTTFQLIFESAFGIREAVGGGVGIAIMQGVKRGLFSNEAGEGSVPNAAATAHVSHPIKQGLVQALGVYVDTLVICTCTAFIIIIYGIYNKDASDGIILTQHAMTYYFGDFGKWFLTLAIFLFAYSTIIANYYYAEANLRFMTSKKWALVIFRIITGCLVLASTYLTLQQAWSLVDLAMALMTICNVVALLLLSKYVIRLYHNYFEQKKQGKNPQFSKDDIPEIEEDIESW